MIKKQKTIIAIIGPTAVGKTAIAIDIALKLHTEIISADSRQCFKELNIGVAKPSTFQLNQVNHHFINSHSIHESINAGVFENYALQKATELFEQNDTIVLAGGTGLYINAFFNGMDEIPSVSETIRQEIMVQYNLLGLGWLQEKIKKEDLEFWEKGEQQNPQRLMRALEVKLSSNKSILSYRNQPKKQRPFVVKTIGLELQKEQLYHQINQRVEEMIGQGLENEVKNLIPYRHLNALQTVGYKELFDFFDKKISLQNAIEDIKKNTRHYAKRQLTWFKKDTSINWFNATNHSEICENLGL